MNFEQLIKGEFEIKNGNFYQRNNGVPTGFSLMRFGVLSPIEYFVRGIGLYGQEYIVKQNYYGDWYLYNGYNPIILLYCQGGENWTSYRW